MRPLSGDGGRDGVERRREGREERVSLGLDHDSVLSLDRGPEDLVVPADQCGPGFRTDGALEPG